MALAPALRFRDNFLALASYCESVLALAHAEGATSLDPVYVRMALLVVRESLQDPDAVLERFINQSYPYWEQVRAKDETFFAERLHEVFQLTDASTADQFRALLGARRADGSHVVSTEQREYIWKVLHSLVKIALHHVSEARGPSLRDGALVYKDPYVFAQVEGIEGLIDAWGIRKTLRV